MTGKRARSAVTGTPLRHSGVGGAKSIPNYLKPSTGLCHDACKHGGHDEFKEKEAAKPKPKPRRQPSAPDEQKRRLIKARSVSRRHVGDVSIPAKGIMEAGETLEWKDIVAYDAVPVRAADEKKRDVVKGKKPFARTIESLEKSQTESVNKRQTESLNKKLAKTFSSTLTGKTSPHPQAVNGATKTTTSDMNMTGKSTKTPKAKKTTALPVEKKAVVFLETAQGDETASVKQGRTLYPHDQEEQAVAIAEPRRPIAYMWSTISTVLGVYTRPSCFTQYFWWISKILPFGSNFHIVGVAALCWGFWKIGNRSCFERKMISAPIGLICYMCDFLRCWAGLEKEKDKEMLLEGANRLQRGATVAHDVARNMRNLTRIHDIQDAEDEDLEEQEDEKVTVE